MNLYHSGNELIKIWHLVGQIMEEIIIAYRKRVYGFLYKYVKIRTEAEDLTQDVMLKIFENKDKFASVRDMDAYILTIAHHVIMDHFNKLHRDNEYKEKVWNTIERSERPVLGSVYQQDFLDNVEKALDLLPDRQQTVFRMSRFEGLSLEEIAKKLDISPYTVKNHLAEATRKIRHKVKPEYFLLLCLAGPMLG